MLGDKVPYLARRAVVPLETSSDSEKAHIPDPEDVQGDVYWMFPKKFEQFLFFTISGDRNIFFKNLKAYLPSVTSGQQTIKNIKKINDNHGSETKLDFVSSQIAFSRKGLNYLGKNDHIGDICFDKGSMRNEKDTLGDMSQWNSVFDKGNIHGAILVTAAVKDTCQSQTSKIRAFFKDSVKDKDVVIMEGRVRPGDGEHFGWRDGISQPGLKGLCIPQQGQRIVNPGVIIMGYPGDPIYDDKSKPQRPLFSKNGSFMVFRKLEQAVLLFEDYINDNFDKMPDPTHKLSDLTVPELKALFGARMFGRFKKGAPLALTPLRDNTDFRKRDFINNFDYSTYFEPSNGTREPYCPFSAHIRKTEPRNLEPFVSKDFLDRSVIIRSGIPYGEDVTKEERKEWRKKTTQQKEEEYNNSPRGLLFVCYQSSIENGFYRQTIQFANNSFFPLTSLIPTNYGPDPIIGGPSPQIKTSIENEDNRSASSAGNNNPVRDGAQVSLQLTASNDTKYEVTGVARLVKESADTFTPNYFVTSRGGEWFFVPGIPILKKWAE